MGREEPAPAEVPCCESSDPCGSRPPLAERPLLSFVEAVKVMALFKVLANDTRIRILHHVVRSGEATVTDIAKALGMKTCQALWFVADEIEEPEPDYRAFTKMDVLTAVSRVG